ncbi:MAG: transglycosylase domain-containing protein [Balneolaceae bacterium]|nr:transglycosylase domain-containing protein [Balneolaceae bacterium]
MSDSNYNDEMDRYFNDPEYRRKKIEEQNKNSRNESSSDGGFSAYFTRENIFKGIGILALLLILGGGAFTYYLIQGLPSIEQLENPDTAIASVVKSRDGVVLDKYFTENRTWVTLEKISPNVVDALIAVEDHRFYDHWGIDMVRTLAIPYHLMMGRIQGGSTLTQQLARNLYKKIGREFSVIRKMREMITAIDLEQNYTKREIIEMYLNTVEYSNSAFGIEAAAQTHYGKSATDLTVSEAATLVGSVNAVYAYNPRLFPERSQQRRNVVLLQMQKRGFITEEVYQKLTEEPITLNYQRPSQSGRESRYFGEYVRQQVMEWTKENGYDLYTDGLTIHTTIDSRFQKHAEEALKTKLDSLQTIFENEWTSPGGEPMDRYWKQFPTYLRQYIRETDRYKNAFSKLNTDQESVVFDSLLSDTAFVDSVKRVNTRLQAGFTAIDPNNGSILAWVGGYNYGNVQFDHVYQSKRQAGSTFKPFVYSVAIDNGYRPYHKFSKYPTKFIGPSGRVWDPRDPSIPAGPEMVPLRQGLARSLNNVTVRLLPEIAGNPGTSQLSDLEPAARKIMNMASNMGIDMSNTQPFPSIALGTAEVSLLDLVSAYTTFANQGVHIEPIAITRIEDKEGNVIKEYHPDLKQEVISPETAYIMIDMMRGVIRGGEDYYGTGVRLRNVYGVRQDVAGKTGTTQNSADNWFVAMMPHITMGAWVGGEDRRIRFPENTFIGQGARSALPIVGSFINRAQSDPEIDWPREAFEAPPGFSETMLYDPDSTNQIMKEDKKGRIGW